MSLRRRRTRRRLLVLLVVVLVGGLGVVTWRVVRDGQVRRLIESKRVEGLEAFARGDHTAALEALDYYVGHRPDDVEALLAQAQSCRLVPRPDGGHLLDAVRMNGEVLRLDPNNTQALHELLSLHQRLGRADEGVNVADRLLALDPDDRVALEARGAGALAVGDHERALDCCDRLIALAPHTLRWYTIRLDVARAMGASSAELLADCDAWNTPDVPDGRFHLIKARLLQRLGRPDEARAEALRAAERGAATAEVLGRITRLLDEFEQTDAIDALLARVRTEHPDATWVALGQARWQWRSGRLAAAAQTLATPAADDQDGWRLAAAVGLGRGDAEVVEEAAAALRALADAAPATERQRRLAWIDSVHAAATGRGTPLELRERASRALALSPEDPIVHLVRGLACEALLEDALAERDYAAAIRLDPAWIEPQVRQAAVLLRLDRPALALTRLVRVLRVHPDADLDVHVLLARAWLATTPRPPAVGLEQADGRPVTLEVLVRRLRSAAPDRPDLAALEVQTAFATAAEEDARATAMRVLDEDSLDDQGLLLLHDLLAERAPDLLPRLDGSPRSASPALVARRAGRLHAEGREAEALARLGTLPVDADDPAIARSARAARARALELIGHPDAGPAVDALLALEPARLDSASFALTCTATWAVESRAERAVEQVEALAGPDAPRSLVARAAWLLRFRLGDPTARAEAMSLAARALRLVPESLPARVIMAQLLDAGPDRDPEQALEQLEQAVAAHPGAWHLYPRLITLNQERGYADRAARHLERFARHATTDADRADIVRLSLRQGDLDTALAALATGHSTTERFALAALYRRAGRVAEAEVILRDLLTDAGLGAAEVARVSAFLATTRRPAEAEQVLDDFAQRRPDRAELARGLHAARLGLDEDAVTHLRRAADRHPADPDVLAALAAAHLRQGQVEAALDRARAGLEVASDHPGCRAALLAAGLRLEGPARTAALEQLDAGAAGEPWRALLDLTTAAAPTVAQLDAARALTRAHPDFLPGWRVAVQLHQRAGRAENAVALARQALTRFPEQAEPAEWLVRLLATLRRGDEALAMTEVWRSRAPDRAFDVDVIAAALLLQRGDAETALARITAHEPWIRAHRSTRADAEAVLLRAWLATEHFDAAATWLAEHASARTAWIEFADAKAGSAGAAALRLVEPYVARDPAMKLRLAIAWSRRLGTDAEASARAGALAEAAAEDAETALVARLLLADLARFDGHPETAEALLRDVLADEPQHVQALNNLAGVLLGGGGRATEAIALIERALALDDASTLHDTHALALLAADRPQDALVATDRALIDRRDAALLVTRARVFVALGREDDARRVLNEATSRLDDATSADQSVRSAIDELRTRLQSSTPSRSAPS